MKIDFEKGDGLVPVIVQDYLLSGVLMLGYMNREAYDKTLAEGKVTFFSRSKGRLWTKGESSGNYLFVKEIRTDCDADTLLVIAEAAGPVCHTGSDTCFGPENSKGFLYRLEKTLEERISGDSPGSYTKKLVTKGIAAVAQKVGEEAVELVIEALGEDDKLFINEAADLVYHTLVLLRAKGMSLTDVEDELLRRSLASG